MCREEGERRRTYGLSDDAEAGGVVHVRALLVARRAVAGVDVASPGSERRGGAEGVCGERVDRSSEFDSRECVHWRCMSMSLGG